MKWPAGFHGCHFNFPGGQPYSPRICSFLVARTYVSVVPVLVYIHSGSMSLFYSRMHLENKFPITYL